MEQPKDHQQEPAESEWPKVKPTIIQRAEEATGSNLTRVRVLSEEEPLSILRVHKYMQILRRKMKIFQKMISTRSMMTHRIRGRILRTSQMRVRIVRTQIKIWMVIWFQELQVLEVETLTCLLRGVELRFNNMWVQEQLYLHKIYRIAA